MKNHMPGCNTFFVFLSFLIYIFVFSVCQVKAGNLGNDGVNNDKNSLKIFSMWDEPSHVPKFDYKSVRIMDVHFPPHFMSQFHFHEHAAVYVFLEAGEPSNQNLGEGWVKVPAHLLSNCAIVIRTDYISSPQRHRVKNLSADESTKIFALVNLDKKLELAQPNEKDAIPVDGKYDNPWFRVQRITLAANTSSEILSFGHDAVLLQCDSGVSRVHESGVIHSLKSGVGAYSWHEKGSKFKLENADAEAREFVVIEVK